LLRQFSLNKVKDNGKNRCKLSRSFPPSSERDYVYSVYPSKPEILAIQPDNVLLVSLPNAVPLCFPLPYRVLIEPTSSRLIPTPHRLRITHWWRRLCVPHLRRRRTDSIPRRRSSNIPVIVHRPVIALPRRSRVVASRMALCVCVSAVMVAVVSGMGRRAAVVAVATMVAAMRVARVWSRVWSRM
jgi:hypothetical protein